MSVLSYLLFEYYAKSVISQLRLLNRMTKFDLCFRFLAFRGITNRSFVALKNIFKNDLLNFFIIPIEK